MMTPLVKICGITRVEDALVAVEEGASLLGMVFVPGSPRQVTLAQAKEIATAARSSESAGDAGLKIVGVFRDQPVELIRKVIESVGLDLVQLHGSEEDETIRSIGIPVIKAIPVSSTPPKTDAHPTASWLLFDRSDVEKGGGTGQAFEWDLLSGYNRSKRFFVAGGIDPENVSAVISRLRPDGIDISSGVEERPGIKSRDKIRSLFGRIRRSAADARSKEER